MEALAREAKTVPFQPTTLASGPVVDHPSVPRGSSVEPPSLLDPAHVRAFDAPPKKTFEFAPSKILDPGSVKTFDVSPSKPFDSAQGRPFDSAQGKAFESAPARTIEFTQARPPESTQSKPFDSAQGKPFDLFQSESLDLTQGTSAEHVQSRPFVQGRPPAERGPIESMKRSTLDESPVKDDSYRSDVIFESVARLAAARSTESSASGALLSSAFPSDSVAVPAGRSLRTFVALFAVVGTVLAGGSYWWLGGRTSTPDSNTRARSSEPAGKIAASPPPEAATAPIVPVKESTTRESKPSRLSVSVEARRSSWIKTTVDGKPDGGRMYAAGETVLLNADRTILLRAGDAGAVYVSVNKGAPTALGPDGAAVTRNFVVGSRPEGTPPAPATSVAAAPTVAGTPIPIPGIPPSQPPPKAAAGSPFPPIPVPLVQPAPPSSPVQPNPAPATVTRNESPSVPLPRTEAATVPPPPATVPAPNAAGNGSPTNAIVAAARQWLDAYQRQERSMMAALSTDSLQLADERRADEKFPAGVAVSRSLDHVSVQIAADTAVLTAVMTEKGDSGTRVSPVSQVWVLSGGQWRVRQVRLVSEARLNQIFR